MAPTVCARKKGVTLPSAREAFVEEDELFKNITRHNHESHLFTQEIVIKKPTKDQAWMLWLMVISGVFSPSKQVTD